MPEIVILDGYTTNPGDLGWEAISQFGQLTTYDRTPPNLVYERAKEAEILIVNKQQLNRATLGKLKKLKCICTLATGYNNIDVAAATDLGITVCNAVGYSSPSVAQHVFALLLDLVNQVSLHNASVQREEWANAIDWTYRKSPLIELAGKTMGIYGYGKIGQQVATIAVAFGMKVLAVRRSTKPTGHPAIQLATFEQMLTESDVISLHAPLTAANTGIINTKHLAQMKSTAFLINTGRGGLVNEQDLKTALLEGQIAGAGLDVLSAEPPPPEHILLNTPNCIITPHIAWATKESRARLLAIVANNIRLFLAGTPQNKVG